MKVLESVLYGVTFLSELMAALFIRSDIRVNRQVRAGLLTKPAPLSAVLNESPGFMMRWTRDKLQANESTESTDEIGRLDGAIRRQSGAIGFLIAGAACAASASVLTLWVH